MSETLKLRVGSVVRVSKESQSWSKGQIGMVDNLTGHGTAGVKIPAEPAVAYPYTQHLEVLWSPPVFTVGQKIKFNKEFQVVEVGRDSAVVDICGSKFAFTHGELEAIS